jgi:hypothetical protein
MFEGVEIMPHVFLTATLDRDVWYGSVQSGDVVTECRLAEEE